MTVTLTFADLLTPQGIAAFAATVTGLVALLKFTFPAIDARVSGALMAFGFTAAGYVLAAVATGVSTLDGALLVFMCWLACATAAVGIHASVSHLTGSPTADLSARSDPPASPATPLPQGSDPSAGS